MYRDCLKRKLDLAFVITALPFFLLLFMVIGPMIYWEDRGKIFYKAPRLGKNGKIFVIYKFRSMKMNAPDLRNDDNSTYNAENDPRVTQVGKLIRKMSIDETPQIFNVLKNEMSVIGPRPDLPEHFHCLEDNEKRKLDVLPGITGYNQAYFRNSTPWKERVKHDIYYVDHLSILFDMKVFFKTIQNIFLQKGIYTVPYKGKKIYGRNFRFYSLPWDTKYFGIKSARVNLKGVVEEKEQRIILDFCKEFEFITITNLNNRNENNEWIGTKTNAVLTDMNVQFLKKVSEEPKMIKESIQVNNACPRNKKIIDIASTAFEYSRFFNDPKLPEKKAKGVYLHWVEAAFGKRSKYYVVARKQKEVVGFILFYLDKKATMGTIDLIAVDKCFRGQAVGKSLILGMEHYLYRNGINKIKVGTQLDNISAVQFYLAVGFQYVSCSAVYHLWNQDKESAKLGGEYNENTFFTE